MFKIESYITSIILANADRYIRNFRKEDAQVSLWGGDATFHNIDLNVDALNEEFTSLFVFTSGYIRDLTIHVPWTKLMSEPVTISVNTIECVMRLKTKNEKNAPMKSKANESQASEFIGDKKISEEITPPASYSSTLTTKIMNNLSIRCENIILKLVEEDIVFSMNIEKLSFENVNEQWVQTITDINAEKLLTRKLLTLSGVTICLDKQNSSGRIDMYLEPLLYRCLIHIRLLRGYNRAISKNSIYMHLDILSDKMSFTICEPQLPMLFKLGETFFDTKNVDTSNDKEAVFSRDHVVLDIDSATNLERHLDDGRDETWGSWLWNMMPTILPQENEPGNHHEDEINPTFNVGFCVKQLEINLKVLSCSIKKKSKKDFKNFLRCNFCGCFCQTISKNNEWFNMQMGVSHAYAEICDEAGHENQPIRIFTAGIPNTNSFMEDTLFNEKFDFFALKMHQKLSNDRTDDVTAEISEAFKYSKYDFMYSIDFSAETHLNLCTENVLLEKSPAFAVDYVKTYSNPNPVTTNSVEHRNENYDNRIFDDGSQTDGKLIDVMRKSADSFILLRFVFGSSIVKINPNAVTRIMYLYKILPCSNYLADYQPSVPADVAEKKIIKNYGASRSTQFTFFDLTLEFHPSPQPNFSLSSSSRKDYKFFDIPETYSFCQATPVLTLYCKCIDGGIKYNKNVPALSSDDNTKIISLKAVDISCSTLLTNQKYILLCCKKFDGENVRSLDGGSGEFNLEAQNISFTASKPNLLLSYYIVKYLTCFLWHAEAKQKYYTNIFCTSLLDDLLLPNHTILEARIENVSIVYKVVKDTYKVRLSVDQCKAFANKIGDDRQKRIIIFSTDERQDSSPLEIILQRCRNCNESCLYPSCISFSFQCVKMYLDFSIYQWLLYVPILSVQQKCHSKNNKNLKETAPSKSIPSRKVSDTSSGSHSRKYSTAYPKPRESVHSSSEPEVHSPLEVTETDTSDLFQTADSVPIVEESVTLLQRIADDVRDWSILLIFGKISDITVYLPTALSVHGKDYADFDSFVQQSLQNNAGPESSFGIFQLDVNCIKLKCDLASSIAENINSNAFVSLPKTGGSASKLTFPWTVSVADLSVCTLLENNMRKPLLKPLFMNSTIGVSFRDGTRGENVITLCVHVDCQPIVVCFDAEQTKLVTNICAAFGSICRIYEENAFAASLVAEKSISTSLVENSEIDYKIRNRLTGWIQWTFTKCSLEFYNTVGEECIRLFLQAEDSIISLEFDEIFHKLKTKIASFGIYHQLRGAESEIWQNGCHNGVILQRCYRQPASSGKIEEDDSEDRFLLATITRARSSNLRARLSLSPESTVSSIRDTFVTEIVLKLCPLDIILPLAVLEKFLAVVKPFINFCRTPGWTMTTQTETRNFDAEIPISCLPLVYFDMPMLRIFIPISTLPSISQTMSLCDTLMCEVGSIHGHCHPENPVMRKPLNLEVYYSMSGTKYAPVEQKLQGQQYQFHVTDISLNSGMWYEIEKMLIKEQISVEKPPSILEQNPAVMWNQGCHPDSKNRIDLKYLSPIISKFSSNILIAPPVEHNFLNAVAYGAYFEVDIVTDMNITLSLQQTPFLVSLYNEYIQCVDPYFQGLEKEFVDTTALLFRGSVIPSRLIDSGIESMEQSSVGSSTFSKVKNQSQLPALREINNKNILSTFKKDVFREVYVTAQNICVTLYTTCEEKTDDVSSKNFYRGLLYSEITQPHLLISDENNSFTVRVGGFHSAMYVPSVFYRSSYFPEVPIETRFYTKFLCIRASRSDRYSKIKNEGYAFKAIRNVNKKWKIECAIEQPVFIDCDVTILQHLFSVTGEFSQEYQKSPFLIRRCVSYEPASNVKCDSSKYLNQIRTFFNSISAVHLHTNRVVTIFKSKNTDRGLFLNVDSTKIEMLSPQNIKSSIETITVQCQVNAIAVSLPNIRNRPFWSNVLSYNQFTALGFEKEEILSTLILKPWNLNLYYDLMWQRWNLFKENPWRRVKVTCDSVHFHLNPSYVNTFAEIAKNYTNYFAELNAGVNDDVDVQVLKNTEIISEFYKDDLRAGAFQYIKREFDDRDLSAYEVVFCNRQIQPYICWKYPQPRKLTKLQIYPVPVEDAADDYLEHCLRCQLQYFNEMTNAFHPYVLFNLSESTIQNVTLPEEKPHMIAAECWRIVIFEVAHPDDGYDFKIDVKLLAGCVRVDSVFQPSLIPNLQVLLNISEIQVNFSAINELDGRMVENYTILPSPDEQLFLSSTCNDVNILVTDYDSGKIVKISGTSKVNLLNYEYLMLQSFIDPFFAEIVLYIGEDSVCRLACIIKNLHLRMSPNFIHTLTVARSLWYGWKPGVEIPWSVTAPYVICNNMNHSVVLRQENTSLRSSLQLPPFHCHLFAWYNPMEPKHLILTIVSGKKEFVSEPFSIKRIGCYAIICLDSEGESCLLFVSIVKHSSVVRQVIIQGSLLIYNLTNSDMDLCVISYGKEAKTKLTSAHAVTKTSFSKNQLLSVTLPLQHKLSFKIRYGSSANDAEQGQWSGLIPLICLEKQCNQTSWMVKIPLKNHKEHFQSFWCQLTWEIIEGLPKYLVVFRPLCSVTSFLPWKIHAKIFNDLDSLINSSSVSDKGMSTDLFIPDTVSLNNYAIEYTLSENVEKCLARMKFPLSERKKLIPTELSISSLVHEIVNSVQNSKWPFLSMDCNRLQWKTTQIHEIKPTIKVMREEDLGCGTKIEIFPWAIIVNTFSYPVLWDISDVIYTVDCNEIISPPCIEGTFKLGLVDSSGQNCLSGTLQLVDDQSFPIPKVTGRIPMNGFVTTMIDCGDYVTFLNITSKSYKETRIINTCSSYVVNNNSNINISCSAWVICRSGDRISASFDAPSLLYDKSINLMANESSTTGHSISRWHKIGNGNVQVLPYLILSVEGNVACPVRICDLSEKQRYPIIFSSNTHSRGKKLPSIFITAQQCEGQVFLTIWEEKSPLITIHNISQLSLNVISSKSEKGVEGITYLPDWNWKFCVAAESSAHFYINRKISEKNKKELAYLLFSVESNKPLKQTKWSYGVQLKPCNNQLVTLPLSQRHIKLAIFRDGFTYVVWIKSATADEVSAKMIRNRLSESFLPVSSGVIPVSTSQEDAIIQIENDDDVPAALIKLYSSGAVKFSKCNILIYELTFTIACDDDMLCEESDIVSFNAKNLFFNFSSSQKPNEVTEDIVCRIDVESYQILNEEYHLRTFDFPVILLCKPCSDEFTHTNMSYVLENLFLVSYDKDDAALNVKIAFKMQRFFNCDVRDIEFLVNSPNVYLEDKYMLRLRATFERIFSATIESSSMLQNQQPPSVDRLAPKQRVSVSTLTSFDREPVSDPSPAKAKSSSSKSVNVSECDTDNSFKSLSTAETQTPNDDHPLKPTPPDSTGESKPCSQGAPTMPSREIDCCAIPRAIVERSSRIAKPLRLRTVRISAFALTVSLRTSTTFYIALDRSPLKFSEFKKEYLVTTPFELGNVLVVHYFMGAVYGTGWAIGSLEFVGSPGVLARDLGTGIKDFVSMPLYGIATGPRGFVLGVAHGSASLMKHLMTGTLSSVTNFAGSWARTLNRFTLDADDLLQAEEIRRVPPANIAEGILQGLSEFGISLLGGISGIAHHPLQYAISNTSNRSLLNSISLGIVGVLTRPISGAAELVARTGQGILSHVGWNMIPVTTRNSSSRFIRFSTLQICDLKYHWTPEFVGVIFVGEAVDAQNLSSSLWVLVTATTLHVVDASNDCEKCRFDFMSYEFKASEQDPTLIVVERPLFSNAIDFCKARIYRFINDTNRSLNIESFHLKENIMYLERSETIFSFCVNARLKNSLLNLIQFLQNMQD